ncbi:Bro-N domain-containing protein [Kitasatospora sp. MAP5-34]|uniref:BRO-N domain-containing protein n=1 Tax=Kitasatospora sp. MAP5-34 TaxID=3035102 RepID=UPI002474F4BF|nr:Bro-N domain-containing protein [Kitasatospora sp. MAP5-34]MDH6580150.1 prophage antirepressor-like protein [Kitasatospora sp. MAP5-34]
MNEDAMVLVRSSFPVTGQPIRVVMINGEPWFVTADVCKVLGRVNPSDTAKSLDPQHTQTIDLRSVTLSQGEGYRVPAGRKPYERGNPMLSVISEAGLYRLIMRSDKRNSKPFQAWVTGDLLPSIRRGDTDIPKQQQRMAQTLAEAVGQQVQILAEIDQDNGGPGIHVRSDGTVHCRHGEMEFRVPKREDDSGPPFGAYFQCPSVERVGIRGGTAIPRCEKLKLVDLTRRLAHTPPTPEPMPEPPPRPRPTPRNGLLLVEVGPLRFHATVQEVADLLKATGQLPA